jgi:hypothetical protein
VLDKRPWRLQFRLNTKRSSVVTERAEPTSERLKNVMRRRQWLKSVGSISLVMIVLFFGLEFRPYLSDGTDWRAYLTSEATAVHLPDSAKADFERGEGTIPRTLVRPITAFVQGSTEMVADSTSRGVGVRTTSFSLSVRWDLVIVYLGVLLAFATAIFQLAYIQLPGEPERPDAPGLASLGAAESLARDVDESARRADLMYGRANLLLIAGVLMAFIGVGVFYTSLPAISDAVLMGPAPLIKGPDFDWRPYLLRTIRSAGVLASVEAIAWFLLRQYRALVEDYKAFYRMYMRRRSFLIAYKVCDRPQVRDADTKLVAALLADDWTGRLEAGETTDTILAQKQIEANPVTAVFERLADRITIPNILGPAGSKDK